jgi:hypothetical protein
MLIETVMWRHFVNPHTSSILWAYTINCVTWPFLKSIISKCLAWLINILFSLSFSPFHNWILVLFFILRSWNFKFFPYTGFCVHAMKDMRRVLRFLSNIHRILNCTYWLGWLKLIIFDNWDTFACHKVFVGVIK